MICIIIQIYVDLRLYIWFLKTPANVSFIQQVLLWTARGTVHPLTCVRIFIICTFVKKIKNKKWNYLLPINPEISKSASPRVKACGRMSQDGCADVTACKQHWKSHGEWNMLHVKVQTSGCSVLELSSYLLFSFFFAAISKVKGRLLEQGAPPDISIFIWWHWLEHNGHLHTILVEV